MKVAILWTKLSGYLNASLRQLAGRQATDLFVANEAATEDAPFADDQFCWIHNRYQYKGAPDDSTLLEKLEKFGPDLILCSWHVPQFQHAARWFKGKAGRVACLDNQWRGSLRQRVAAATSSWHLQRCYDAAFVPGERQALWANKMGFSETNIWRGLLTGDVDRFNRVAANSYENDKFLFVGRTSPEKGVETLLIAYEKYRNGTSRPWPLTIVGSGPLDSMLNRPGIEHRSFTQPKDLPQVFAQMGCFVLASTFEPWAVVIHEAASAGLPIICSKECGAAVHLVQDDKNGFLVAPGNTGDLANALSAFTNLPRERRRQMSELSISLAQQFSPAGWANCVVEKGRELLERVRSERRN